jgi:hypothetical protein
MKLERLRNWIGIPVREAAACPDRIMDGGRTDRDLALLAQAEREFRDASWRQESILSGIRK